MSCECRVSVRELAAALQGAAVEGFVPPGVVGPDWRGEASVPVKIAAEAVRGHREGVARHEAKTEGHRAYLDERAARRAEIVRSMRVQTERDWRISKPAVVGGAFVDPHTRAVLNSRNEEAEDAGRAAAIEAAERFDERNPALELDAWLKTSEGRAYA